MTLPFSLMRIPPIGGSCQRERRLPGEAKQSVLPTKERLAAARRAGAFRLQGAAPAQEEVRPNTPYMHRGLARASRTASYCAGFLPVALSYSLSPRNQLRENDHASA
jgi:hypothetical protein